MKINDRTLAELAVALRVERKRQKLSREGAAAVCGVSTSFIRDAESNPENCSLAKLAKLVNGLGLSLEVAGFESPPPHLQPSSRQRGIAAPTNRLAQGLTASAIGFRHTDFGVPDSQLVEPRSQGGIDDPSSASLERAALAPHRATKNRPKDEAS